MSILPGTLVVARPSSDQRFKVLVLYQHTPTAGSPNPIVAWLDFTEVGIVLSSYAGSAYVVNSRGSAGWQWNENLIGVNA